MSKAQHTPGPWKIVNREVLEDGSVYPMHIVGGVAEYQVCLMESPQVAAIYESGEWDEGKGKPFRQHNSRIIASAPELLNALESIVSRWSGYPDDQTPREVKDARAAIAKAKGE